MLSSGARSFQGSTILLCSTLQASCALRGLVFQGFTPQVHHLPTALRCEGLGEPECAVSAVGYG